MFKNFLVKKVDKLLLKIWLGAVFVSILIFSLSQLGYTFQIWVMQYKDSMALAFGVFSATLVLSLIGLFLLFRNPTPRQRAEAAMDDMIPADKPFLSMSMPEKGFVFFRGVIDGVRFGRQPINRY
jgi:hypothetical protein